MNEKKRPPIHDLSLYYDGLLDEEKRQSIETFLQEEGNEKKYLDLFETFDSALDIELPDDKIDALLCDHVKIIHERLVHEEQKQRQQSLSLWDWLLMPRNLLAGLAALLLMFCVYSTLGPLHHSTTSVTNSNNIALNPTPLLQSNRETSLPVASSPNENATEPEDSILDETQKQVILAAAGFAKSALSTSVGYVKKQGEPLGETLSILPQTADLGIAFKALTASKSEDKTSDSSEMEALSPNQQLARTGTKQLALALGASILSLVSVI